MVQSKFRKESVGNLCRVEQDYGTGWISRGAIWSIVGWKRDYKFEDSLRKKIQPEKYMRAKSGIIHFKKTQVSVQKKPQQLELLRSMEILDCLWKF